MGLTYLFVALWIMSIFGNYDVDNWYSVTQASLLPWALLFAVAAGSALHQPENRRRDAARLRPDVPAINLYTRYFEYFWDGMNKVVFFLILAASLAVIGRYAEKIWHAGSSVK
jgi:hypothetical protein